MSSTEGRPIKYLNDPFFPCSFFCSLPPLLFFGLERFLRSPVPHFLFLLLRLRVGINLVPTLRPWLFSSPFFKLCPVPPPLLHLPQTASSSPPFQDIGVRDLSRSFSFQNSSGFFVSPLSPNPGPPFDIAIFFFQISCQLRRNRVAFYPPFVLPPFPRPPPLKPSFSLA